jgi:hypothetical protein
MINLLPTELFKSKSYLKKFDKSQPEDIFLFHEYLDISNTSGLYYKPMMIVNDESSIINKLETSLTDDTRVIIYDHHMFMVQATDHKILSIC